jgi:serine/threonine protein kinase/Flp pilus assembly protein TadD
MNQTSEPITKDARISRAVEEYLAAWEAGCLPNRDEFLARQPDIADALGKCIDGLEFIRSAAPGLRESTPALPLGDVLQPEAPVGDFRIVREVGRGGMGVVYEAVQISLGRRVALKVLPFAATMDPRHLLRFQNEARSAASLEHPHIVPVYGVGSERGVHYYAMKFIDGQTVAALIAQQRGDPNPAHQHTQTFPASTPAVDTAPRAQDPTAPAPRDAAFFRRVAEWGIQAAEALEHAHSLGIVHRDIKPANLIIDGQGKLWGTDFGLAHTATDAGLTMTGDVLGTLRYMSPEQAQASHGLVDHRTDVYSLGITLYEMLTMHAPFEAENRQELLRQIVSEEPRRLRKIDKEVSAELETIVLKAIEKRPEDRYIATREMADDLRRFVLDEPIRAKRAGVVQRIRKWGRRHQPAVAAAVGFLVLAMAVLAGSTIAIWRAWDETDAALHKAQDAKDNETAERQKAEAAQERAMDALRATTDDVVEKLIGAKPALGPTEKEFLESALKRWQTFAAEKGEGSLARCVRAEGEYRVAYLRAKLGQNEVAEERFREALVTLEKLAAEFPAVPEYRHNLALSYSNLGYMLAGLGKRADAEAAFRQALAIQEELAADFPAVHMYRQEVARSHHDLGSLLVDLGKSPEAEAAYRQALAIQEKLAADFPAVPQYRLDLATSHYNLGAIFAGLGKSAEAEAAYRNALTIQEKLAANFPASDRCRLRN